MQPVPGAMFGRYEVIRLLGRGGMGVVYEARDTSLDRLVALKTLDYSLSVDPAFRERFVREAAVLARLDSPHVVQVFEAGELDGVLFLVTQLIADGDLRQWLTQHGPLDLNQVVRLGLQLADALQDAHSAGVIHRDVKPSNVLLRQRPQGLHAYLGDFGIATTASESGQTMTGSVVGSWGYLAPERHQGHRADERSDLYALACVLFEAASGQAPYSGTDLEIAMAHINEPPPRLEGDDPASQALNEVLGRALAKSPSDRYADAASFGAALRTVPLSPVTQPSVAPAVPPAEPEPSEWSIEQTVLKQRPAFEVVEPAAPTKRRRKRWLLVPLVAVLALVAGGVIWVVNRSDDPCHAWDWTCLEKSDGTAFTAGDVEVSDHDVARFARVLCHLNESQSGDNQSEIDRNALTEQSLQILANTQGAEPFAKAQGSQLVGEDSSQLHDYVVQAKSARRSLPDDLLAVFDESITGYGQAQLTFAKLGRTSLKAGSQAKVTSSDAVTEGDRLWQAWAKENVEPKAPYVSAGDSGTLTVAVAAKAADGRTIPNDCTS